MISFQLPINLQLNHWDFIVLWCKLKEQVEEVSRDGDEHHANCVGSVVDAKITESKASEAVGFMSFHFTSTL